MRIGLIAPPWLPVPPPRYGGTEVVVDGLARGLVAAGHEVLLAAPSGSTCPVPLVPDMPEPGAGTSAGWSAVTELYHVARAYAAMTDVDLVHDHTVAGPFFRNRPASLPVVTTNHGPFSSLLGDLYRLIGPEVAMVAISHRQAADAAGARVDRVIHHGIDVAAVPRGAGDGGYVAFLGRMSPDKGPREAILIARQAGFRLLMSARVQGRQEEDYFESQIAPLLGPEAEFVGELSAREKYQLMGGAVAFLNPIQWPEPFGLVMIEALATGTPVVGTGYGAAPEIVDDGVTGYLRTGTGELAEALSRAPGLDRDACRRAAEVRFSLGRMVADHVSLYQQLLQDNVLRHGRYEGR
ncbi:glycosyltransferase family 4 protein [Arthrobacter sp. ISL-72]|uniref:glycosyltransferase family 4 protein n=1 Tax=Arthrobacter sp. ISL-72 TaxID=2819114 RepID=UPI001BE78F2E|nr:glycosyltransferase family 4 protein [Arthrobacter sp. ISL-72]MBT2596698.1 glycosyltransferase family 4 protein [Arthrobacter sp. ISL-72]